MCVPYLSTCVNIHCVPEICHPVYYIILPQCGSWCVLGCCICAGPYGCPPCMALLPFRRPRSPSSGRRPSWNRSLLSRTRRLGPVLPRSSQWLCARLLCVHYMFVCSGVQMCWVALCGALCLVVVVDNLNGGGRAMTRV